MIRERLLEIRERRAALSLRAAEERARVGALLQRSEQVERWVGLGMDLGRAMRRRPWWIAIAVATLAALRPRRVLRWAASGWSLWQIYRRGGGGGG
ncbi:MAG TPA: hypothetical protein VMI15_03855, partial [Burkholderiales bacterium]|nr:hypothetical protein [Burkholderiales bacterium]